MIKLFGAAFAVLVATMSASSAQQIIYQSQPSGAASAEHGAPVRSGKSVYWTASGPLYVDQQLDAESRVIFQSDDRRRFRWLNDRANERLDREQGHAYSVRVR